ncbi:MAG: thiamine phosphate synthase [Candidatus Margulisbacteria bacterium]|nr:thiamine phosphate synthase [Candidatus Margulisiibacteriota bacterium]
MNRKERLAKFKQIDLYPVTNESLSNGRSNLDILQAVIAGGAKIIQLRDKNISQDDFLELAKKFREITAQSKVLLIINDHLDVALEVKADGVHLGQNDLLAAAARKSAPELLIGVSTHNVAEAVKAEQDGADYVNIGPIFKTQTKDVEPIGPESIKPIAAKIKIPFTVMGGINFNNIDMVLAQGARHVAVISAVTQAPDIQQAASQLIKKINNLRL